MEERQDTRTTGAQDRATESAVLQYVLFAHPSPITLDDLTRELGNGEDTFAGRDSVERAVRELAACGLLLRSERLVLPSLAALRFDQLLSE